MTDTENLKGTTEMDAVGNRSTHFFSLRGFPGILVGIYALLGAITFRQLLNNHQNLKYYDKIYFFPDIYLFKIMAEGKVYSSKLLIVE